VSYAISSVISYAGTSRGLSLRGSSNSATQKSAQLVSLSRVRFGALTLTSAQMARYVDHTKLTYKEGEVPEESIKKLCQEAKQYNFAAVCVRPDMINLSKQELAGSQTLVATVIGFPDKKYPISDPNTINIIGNVSLSKKKAEARQAMKDGADELDLVMNVSQFIKEDANPLKTYNEFREIKKIAGNNVVKVILETDLLTPAQIKKATEVCVDAGVDFVKTSTGMVDGGKGATVENVTLMYETLKARGVENKVLIKASGGIKTAEDATKMIEAGASRLGTSSGVPIMQGLAGKDGY
jgi:deoxyribose-phosphate aldolase